MMSDDRRPDWNYWKNVPSWTILQAVALSLNIDPNKLYYRVLPGTMGLCKARVESPEFAKRLSLAIENIENLAVYKAVEGEYEKWKITRASFSALGRSLKWKVPPQMKARAEPDKREVEILNLKQQVEALTKERDTWKHQAEEDQNQLKARPSIKNVSKKWPWGTRETKLLAHFAGAAEEFWSRYDPEDDTTAPTNDQVKDWLMKRNVAKRVAEVMAQILRADKLPKGNHKR